MTPQRLTAMEVAARLRLTPAAGEALVARSVCLVGMLPATRAALGEGRIDTRRAEVVADELGRHTPAVARRVEAEVLDRAEALTTPRLRQALQRALHRLAPTTMEQRRDHAASARHVTITPAADGMAWLEAYLPAEDAAALQAAIEAAAAALKRTGPGDRRTLGQRRADALAQMGWLALSTGRLGGCVCGQGQRLDRRHRRPVTVQVTVAATTLLGLDQQPGQLAGYGPLPGPVARRLAAEGTWRRLLTDPASGTVLDYGHTWYPPPPTWSTTWWPATGPAAGPAATGPPLSPRSTRRPALLNPRRRRPNMGWHNPPIPWKEFERPLGVAERVRQSPEWGRRGRRGGKPRRRAQSAPRARPR